MGNVQVAKPEPVRTPAARTSRWPRPARSAARTTLGPNTASPGATITYRLDYTNLATTAANDGTNVVLRDVLDEDETFVDCSPACTDSGGSPAPSAGTSARSPTARVASSPSRHNCRRRTGSPSRTRATSQALRPIRTPTNNVSTLTTTTFTPPPTVHPTTTSVSCSPNPATFGGSTTCTATVTDTARAADGPDWLRHVQQGQRERHLQRRDVHAGRADLELEQLLGHIYRDAVGTGNHAIGAGYGADSTHTASSGSTDLTFNQRH